MKEKLSSLKEKKFSTLENEQMKKFKGGLSDSGPNYTETWHKSTGTQTEDGLDGPDPV